MRPDQIEQKSISYLMDLFSTHNLLRAYLSNNDTTPSWDGDIFIYNEKNKDIGAIRVQVKGHYNFKNSQKLKEKVKVQDLKNYLQVGGTLYLVVHIDENDKKSCSYIEMHPNYLKKTLEQLNSGQETKTLSLKKLPTDPDKIYDKLLNFKIQCEAQMSFKRYANKSLIDIIENNKNKPLTLGFNAPAHINRNSIEFFQENSVTLLHIVDDGVRVPLKEMIGEEVFLYPVIEVKKPVFLDDQKFFNRYVATRMDKNDEKFKIELCIGNDGFFTIDFTKKSDDKEEDFYKLDFKYKRPAGLDNAIYALEFFVKFLESDKLILNQAEINLSDLDLSSIEGFSYKDERDILIGFRTILNKFDISYEDLDLNNLDKNELHNLEMIYQSLFLNELVKFPEALTALFITSKIGPISLLLYAVGQPEKNTYRLLDAYGHLCWAGVSHIKNPSQSEIKATPSFSIVDKDIILKSTNLTIDALDNLLNELKNSDRTFDLGWLNNFGMELIKTYDESSTIDYLKMAQKVFRWLINEEEQNYYKINYYQAKKREGNLKEEDINYLEKILENAEESLQKTTNNFSTNQLKNHKSDLLKPSVKKSAEIQTIFGCQVLLEDNYSARKTFELFPDDLQKEYEDHPIYKLFKTK